MDIIYDAYIHVHIENVYIIKTNKEKNIMCDIIYFYTIFSFTFSIGTKNKTKIKTNK